MQSNIFLYSLCVEQKGNSACGKKEVKDSRRKEACRWRAANKANGRRHDCNWLRAPA
ncbi:MAG: hypothetical protein ACR2KX_20510 [Chitinophagaceae bacterium]